MKTKYKYLILILVTILASIWIYNYVEENTMVATEEDILNTQTNLEKNILEDTNYSIDNPKVILNPYGISPLTALIIFKTNDLASTTITVKGKDGDEDIVNTFIPSKLHLISVYGLYPDYNNTVVINSSGEEKTIKIKTDKLPNELSNATVCESDSNDFYFTTSSDTNGLPAAYDKNGNIRWYLTKSYGWDFTRLSNGYVLLGNYSLMKDPYYSSSLVEMDLLGKIYFEYNIPGGYHHDVYEMTNGNLIAISNNFESNTKEDFIVTIDRNSGEIIKTFDLNKLFGSNNEGNWINLNSIAYDAITNSIITVGNKKNMIVNIDYNTGEINWIIADKNKMTNKYHKYLLNGEGMLPNNPEAALLADDNLAYINKVNDENYLVIYKINNSNRTFEEVKQINLGKASKNLNIEYNNGKFLIVQDNVIKEISDDEELNILKFKNDIYSAKPTKMYAGDIFMTGSGVRIGTTGITPTVKDKPLLIKKKDNSIYKHYDLSIVSDVNRLVIKGTFKKNDEVQIILDNVLSKKTYDVDIDSGTETVSGKMETTTYINKQGIYGKYYIYIKINGVNYKLSKYALMS